MIHNVRQRTLGHVRISTTQISLRIRAFWSESLLGAFWIAKDVMFLLRKRRLWSDCADVQADLSLFWAYISEDAFCFLTLPLTKCFTFFRKYKKNDASVVVGVVPGTVGTTLDIDISFMIDKSMIWCQYDIDATQ